MSATVDYLAVDLGAESGRAVLGAFDGERVSLREVHRFQNAPVRLPDGLHWDVLRIFDEVKNGLVAAAEESQDLASVGVDTWGVDFGLLDRAGALVANPYHYRDGRTDGMVELAAERVPRAEIYRTTGIQFMPINTLYQLLAYEGSPLLEAADTLLMMPDLVNYWLTGEKACEYTISSTSQLYDLGERDWARDLIGRMGIPERIFPESSRRARASGISPRGCARRRASDRLPVTAVASHDTASAVAAVPAEGDFAYISSGTWSLVGVETDEPVTDEEALRHNFTNEGGFGGKVRLLRNVMGLWLLQECKRTWARDGRDYSYDELTRLAEEATPFGALVDPDQPSVPRSWGHARAHGRVLRGYRARARPRGRGSSRGASTRASRSSTGGSWSGRRSWAVGGPRGDPRRGRRVAQRPALPAHRRMPLGAPSRPGRSRQRPSGTSWSRRTPGVTSDRCRR